MKADAARPLRLERLLAETLNYGTWLASAVIALGLALTWSGQGMHAHGMLLVTIGIALFILLPVARVGMMAVVFVRERDYRFGAVAGLVLLIMLAGFALAS